MPAIGKYYLSVNYSFHPHVTVSFLPAEEGGAMSDQPWATPMDQGGVAGCNSPFICIFTPSCTELIEKFYLAFLGTNPQKAESTAPRPLGGVTQGACGQLQGGAPLGSSSDFSRACLVSSYKVLSLWGLSVSIC